MYRARCFPTYHVVCGQADGVFHCRCRRVPRVTVRICAQRSATTDVIYQARRIRFQARLVCLRRKCKTQPARLKHLEWSRSAARRSRRRKGRNRVELATSSPTRAHVASVPQSWCQPRRTKRGPRGASHARQRVGVLSTPCERTCHTPSSRSALRLPWSSARARWPSTRWPQGSGRQARSNSPWPPSP